MTIAPLRKITLCGVQHEKTSILGRLQALGCMHLIALRPPPAEVEDIAPVHAEAARKALRFLTVVPEPRRQIVRDPGFDVSRFVEGVSDLMQRLRAAGDRRDFLEHRIAAVAPWGDIAFPPLERLKDNRLWFYELPLRHLNRLKDCPYPWQIVRRDSGFAYLVLIAPEEPPDDVLPVPRTHVGAKPLSALEEELDDVEIALEELRAQRHGMTRYIYLLSANMAEAENRASLAHAEQQTHDDGRVVAVQGWVPEDALPAIETLAETKALACLIEAPALEDEPPTLIEQPENMAAGRDLTLFYQVPDYRSWDPTLILVGSFCVFFAMIVADAGYGVLLLLLLLFNWRRLGTGSTVRAYRRLGLAIAACTIVYGVLAGSYFGAAPPQASLFASMHVISVYDFDTMMRVAVIIGALHVCTANAMIAYAHRRQRSGLASLGWIGVILGALTLWLGDMTGPAARTGYGLIAAGFAFVLLFSSDRAVERPRDWLLRLFDGVRSLPRAVNAFSDVLSYLRLFALGLASASLAATFNELAASAHRSLSGLGLLAAALILLLGHSLNLGLGIMSGVVHGLRLNFIEFFNWGLPKEGTAFRRFARKEVQP